MIVDLHQNYPELQKDEFFNAAGPLELPYTDDTKHLKKDEPKGSAEVQEEADNASSHYYKLSYAFHRNSVKVCLFDQDFFF